MEKQSTGHQRQSWLTHAAYPAGEHPAQPVPEPAPFWAETTVMPTQGAVDALSSKLHQAPKRRGWRVGEAVAATVTVALTATLALGAGYLIGAGRTATACEEALVYSDELNAETETYGILVAEAFDALASFDQAAVDAVVEELDAFGVQHAETLAAYESAAEDCRAAGGELW